MPMEPPREEDRPLRQAEEAARFRRTQLQLVAVTGAFALVSLLLRLVYRSKLETARA